ncbi:methylenetetrahydrofolate reductase [Helicobacter sp. 23-1045]
MKEKVDLVMEKMLGDSAFLSYEIVPQKAFSVESILKSIKQSAVFGEIDAFVCTDSPLSRLKHSAILASIKVQNFLNKPAICTISARDKNSIAIQGEILGLNEFEVRIFLVLRGDPIKLGDNPQAKAVFEGNSFMLLEIIRALNNGVDLGGAKIKDFGRRIYPLSVANAYANDMENIAKKMRKKIALGALALITQPIFDAKNAKDLLAMMARINADLGTNAKLIFGFYPITSLKTAEFLYHKLPGCFMPQSWIDALRDANGDLEIERRIGVELSKNLYKEISALHPKIHFMCGNKIEIAEQIVV